MHWREFKLTATPSRFRSSSDHPPIPQLLARAADEFTKTRDADTVTTHERFREGIAQYLFQFRLDTSFRIHFLRAAAAGAIPRCGFIVRARVVDMTSNTVASLFAGMGFRESDLLQASCTRRGAPFPYRRYPVNLQMFYNFLCVRASGHFAPSSFEALPSYESIAAYRLRTSAMVDLA